MTEHAELTATEALEAFAKRTISPVELMGAVLARAEATETSVNALTEWRVEASLDAARRAEERWMGQGPAPRALEGVPTALKDTGRVAGWATTFGSNLEAAPVETTTSAYMTRVLDAGAICHARTATPEYSCAAVTWSLRHGVTRNPHNLGLTPGGSSGGAAAALAAGSTTLAVGSDIGGSIRIPASCCGVVGFKPSKGRCPVDVPFNLDPYCHTGPMARSVADARLLYEVMAGPTPNDPTLLPAAPLPKVPSDLTGWRVAVSEDLGLFGVEDEVLAATRSAAETFHALGAEVVDVGPIFKRDVPEAILTHLRALFGTSITPKTDAGWDQMTPYGRAFAKAAAEVTPMDIMRGQEIAGQAGLDLAQAMAGFDVLICPTTATPAVAADYDPSGAGPIVAGREVEPMLGWVMTAPFNMLGYHPVISVPSGVASNGCPIGLQIVGQPYADGQVLAAAELFEEARGRTGVVWDVGPLP